MSSAPALDSRRDGGFSFCRGLTARDHLRPSLLASIRVLGHLLRDDETSTTALRCVALAVFPDVSAAALLYDAVDSLLQKPSTPRLPDGASPSSSMRAKRLVPANSKFISPWSLRVSLFCPLYDLQINLAPTSDTQ